MKTQFYAVIKNSTEIGTFPLKMLGFRAVRMAKCHSFNQVIWLFSLRYLGV